MRLETTEFREGKKNDKFKCGMFSSPYMSINQCSKLATCLVTDESYVAYREYWHVWNKFHEYYVRLPMMHLRLICDEHKTLIQNLPDNPRPSGYRRKTERSAH